MNWRDGRPFLGGPMEGGPMYPGQGYPQHPLPSDPVAGRPPPVGPHGSPETLFGRLSAGRPLGRKVWVLVGTQSATNPSVNALEVRGPDDAAMNLNLVVPQPRVIPLTQGGAPIAGAPTVTQAQNLVTSQNVSGAVLNGDPQVDAPGIDFQYTPIIARIEWGVGGAQAQQVDIDCANGLCINVAASYLRVNFLVDPYVFSMAGNALVALGDAAIYELAAFVGPGHAKPQAAQRTIALPPLFVGPAGGGAFNGTSPILPVPAFAKYARLIALSSNSPPPVTGWVAQILFGSSPGAGNVVDPTITLAPVFKVLGAATVADNGTGPGSNGVPVPNGGMYFTVVNGTAGSLVPTIIFDLAI